MATKKVGPKRGAVLRVRKHLYRPDGIPDHRGEDRCEDCGLGRGHAVHDLEPVDPEVGEVSHRMTGEREG